jgi:hypothetical protein
MKIEVGKYYKTAGGRTYGPMKAQPSEDNDPFYKFRARGHDGDVHFSPDGKFYPGQDHELDLVEEVEK